MKLSLDRTKTVVTKRGQTSIPALFRKASQLKKGQTLEWEMISKREFRVWVISKEKKKGRARSALGYAIGNKAFSGMSSDQVLAKLREGE